MKIDKNTTPNPHLYEVFLNNEVVFGWISADSDQGKVKVVLVNETYKSQNVIELTGEVRIKGPWDE